MKMTIYEKSKENGYFCFFVLYVESVEVTIDDF